MKIFIVLALVAVVAADWKPRPQEVLRQARLECQKSLDMPQELLEKANRLEYPESALMNKFILCGGRSSELWDDSKGWMADRIMILLGDNSDLGKEEMRQLIDGCLDDNSQGSSMEDWAARNFRCILQSKLRDAFSKMMKKIQ